MRNSAQAGTTRNLASCSTIRRARRSSATRATSSARSGRACIWRGCTKRARVRGFAGILRFRFARRVRDFGGFQFPARYDDRFLQVPESESMASLILPRVQAMVLCDDLDESDEDSEAINLIGVRTVIATPVFPMVRSQLCVFLQMSGHRGEARCHIEIECLATDEVIQDTEPLTFQFINPTIVVPAYFRLVNCVFSTAGLYYVQVYADTKLVGERPLLIREEI